jgi:hypothetical protein
MTIEQIARATHEMNRTFCQILGDDSQMAWEDAPDWQRESKIAAVSAISKGETITPEEQHKRWMCEKLEDGWKHGEIKDAAAKTHPCLVPYAELPPEQRAKNKIFRVVAIGLLQAEAASRYTYQI